MIRLIFVALFLVIFLILSIPVFLIEWLIGKVNPHARDISSLRIVQGAFYVIAFLSGCHVTVKGMENVPKDEAVLYIGNHRSYFDVVLTYARCPGLTSYMAKKEVARVPLLSTWMRFLHCLFLDRKDIKLLPFHEGSFKVATKTDCLIVPMAITNTSRIFEDHIPFIRSTDVVIEYGKPFRPSELTKEQKKGIGGYTREIIQEMVQNNLR